MKSGKTVTADAKSIHLGIFDRMFDVGKERIKKSFMPLYERIEQKSPTLGGFLRRCYRGKPFNSYRKKVSGRNNRIRWGNSILSSVLFDIRGNSNVIEIGNGCLLDGVTFFIRGDHHEVRIGKRCRFNRGGLVWVEDNYCMLKVGDDTTFEDVHIAVNEPSSKVEIGNDCMFAYDIDIRTGDSHSIIDPKTGKRLNVAEDVLIGNHVWVAAHSILLKGVSLSDDSIVATGSVVTTGFTEKGVIVAGNPARIVRQGVTWSRRRFCQPT